MIDYQDWMKRTYAMGFKRSDELKALDEALKNFSPQVPSKNLAVRDAFEKWAAKERLEGHDWMESRRNKNGAITDLKKDLGIIKFRTPEEIAAFGELRRANADNLKTLFRGKTLQVKDAKAASKTTVKDVVSAAKELKSAVSAIKAGGTVTKAASDMDARKLVTDFCGGTSNVLAEHLGEVVGAVSDLIPILGLAKTGISLVSKLSTIAQNSWLQYHDAERKRAAFAPGDPVAAFDAVMVCIGNETKEAAVDAAMIAAKLATDIAAQVATCGAASIAQKVTSAANAAGKLAKDLYLFARDAKEIEAANKLIMAEQFDLSLFKASPLLGCYVVCCSDWSALVAMSLYSYGKPGFKVEVESLKQKADPVIAKANHLIIAARYEVKGLVGLKGIGLKQASTFDKLLAKVKSFVITPEDKATWDKSRIQGIGPDDFKKGAAHA